MSTDIKECTDKCVYVHELNGAVVYVGSGTVERSTATINRTKEHFEKLPYLTKRIVQLNMTESDAKDLEQKLINEYWHTGNLFNKRQKVAKTLEIRYEEISKFLYYDETAKYCLRRRYSTHGAFPEHHEAGSTNNRGYIGVKIKSTRYPAHRIIYALCHKVDLRTDLVVDHIDGNPGNNIIANLRLVTQSDNCKNRKHKKSNTGFQAITDTPAQARISVYWQENLQRKRMRFSYCPNPKKNRSVNHYQTRELALEAAIAYRDSLVQQGLIVLT